MRTWETFVLPKRRKSQHIASLREFLHTGALGPLNVNMTLLDVAALLGPPTDWIVDKPHCSVPFYWSYGPLEIEFHHNPPYAINWFQIEHPEAIARPRDELADRLLLSMDRIDISAPPSRMLRHFSGVRDVVVGTPKDHDWSTLEIYAGSICLIYLIADEAIPAGEISPDEWLRHFDENCRIDSIYSFRETAFERQSPKESYRNMSAERYLAIVGTGWRQRRILKGC